MEITFLIIARYLFWESDLGIKKQWSRSFRAVYFHLVMYEQCFTTVKIFITCTTDPYHKPIRIQESSPERRDAE